MMPAPPTAARLALLAVALSALTGLAQGDDGSNVVELSSGSIDSTLSKGTWLVEFYAPWCGYCRRLEPTYAEVAKQLKISGSGVQVAKVDGSKYKALGARFGVDGFPTIFLITKGEIRRYAGDRSKEALVEYASRGWVRQDPSFSSLTSPLGILGRILGVLLDGSVALQAVYERVRVPLGLSHPFALGMVAVLTAILGSVMGLVMSFVFPEQRAAAPTPQQAQRKQD